MFGSSIIRITKGEDKVDRICTSGESEYLGDQPISPESTFPATETFVEFDVPNEMTLKTIFDAESGIDVVECEDEEDFFHHLDE